MKVDYSLYNKMDLLSKKNGMTFMDVSREIADMLDDMTYKKKKRREIIKIIKNVEF